MPIFRHVFFATLALSALTPFVARADDATIDTRFNPNGVDPGWRRAYDNIQPTANQFIVDAAKAPDGGYVLAGSVTVVAGFQRIFLAKFRPNGDYDSSFGGTAATGNAGVGRVLKNASFTAVTAMTIDAQGRILVVGEISDDFGVVRFNPDGTDDMNFAGDGSSFVSFDLDSAHSRVKDVPTSVTTAPDGSVYVAGTVEDVTSGGSATQRLGVVKFLPNGVYDDTYGTLTNGRQVFNCGYACDGVNTVARIVYDAPRNRLVIGGDFEVSEFDTDWFITTQYFGPSPSVQTQSYVIDFGGAGNPDQRGLMKRLAVQTDGKIVALGYAFDPNNDVFPVVLRAQSGSLAKDTSFGSNGILLPGPINVAYYDLALDSSGRIVLVGYYFGYDVAVMTRLMPNGSIDTGFNGDNVPSTFLATTSSGAGAATVTFFGRVFLDAGRPVVAGMATDSATTVTDYDLIITRLQADRIFTNGFQP
ncbi:MAG: hypothetical protein IPP82_15345 [Xanthomonadales bacterium]|nr:hypothetical protein [Xanthomonadales bacterium]